MRCTRGKIKGDGYNEEAKRRKEKKERVGRERERGGRLEKRSRRKRVEKQVDEKREGERIRGGESHAIEIYL